MLKHAIDQDQVSVFWRLTQEPVGQFMRRQGARVGQAIQSLCRHRRDLVDGSVRHVVNHPAVGSATVCKSCRVQDVALTHTQQPPEVVPPAPLVRQASNLSAPTP